MWVALLAKQSGAAHLKNTSCTRCNLLHQKNITSIAIMKRTTTITKNWKFRISYGHKAHNDEYAHRTTRRKREREKKKRRKRTWTCVGRITRFNLNGRNRNKQGNNVYLKIWRYEFIAWHLWTTMPVFFVFCTMWELEFSFFFFSWWIEIFG